MLIRAAVHDDLHRARRAAKILAEADLIAVPEPVLCEFVRVLRRGYKKSAANFSHAILRLMRSSEHLAIIGGTNGFIRCITDERERLPFDNRL